MTEAAEPHPPSSSPSAPPAPDPARQAESLLRRVAGLPATLGAGRLVTIDGPSGSGKTTLAAAVADRAGDAVAVVHTDDLYDGWDGLAAAPAALGTTVLPPLARGGPGRYRRYDWAAERYAEWVTVPPAALLVVEGVGSWSPTYADLVTLSVWVEAPPGRRLERGVARDGEAVRPRLVQWARVERAWHAARRSREHADVLLEAP